MGDSENVRGPSIVACSLCAACLLVGCKAEDESGGQFASGTSGTAGATVTGTTEPMSDTDMESSSSTAEEGSSTGAGSSDSGESSSSTGTPGSDSSSTGDPCAGTCDPMTQVCVDGACADPLEPEAGAVVIAEFLPNPVAAADSDGEWVELVNVSDTAVDIAGCSLTDAGGVGDDHLIASASLVLPPQGMLLLAKSTDTLVNGGLPAVDYAFGTTFSLTNDADEIVLDCSGVIVDQVVYDATWAFDDGRAAALSGDQLDADANDDASNWCGASAPYGDGDLGTPGVENDAC